MASIDNDWTLGNIEHRDDIITSEILGLLDEWNRDYQTAVASEGPSKEDMEQIEKFKKMGWTK